VSPSRIVLSLLLISSLSFSNPSTAATDRLSHANLAATLTTLTGIFASYAAFDALWRSIRLTHIGENAYNLADTQLTRSPCGADDTSDECMPYVAREHARGLKAAAGWTAMTIVTTFTTGVSFLFSSYFLRLNTNHRQWCSSRCQSCGSFDALFHVPFVFGIVAVSSSLFNVFYWSGLLTRRDYGDSWKSKWPEIVDIWENIKAESNIIITEVIVVCSTYAANWGILSYTLLNPGEANQIRAQREAAREVRIAAALAAAAAVVAANQNQPQNAIVDMQPALPPAGSQVAIQMQAPSAGVRGASIVLRAPSIEQFSRAASVGAGAEVVEEAVTFHTDDSKDVPGEFKRGEKSVATECCICLDALTAENPGVLRFKCDHMNVHGSCIDHSMAVDISKGRAPRCPNCRDENLAASSGS
jgi:hypothetical protein